MTSHLLRQQRKSVGGRGIYSPPVIRTTRSTCLNEMDYRPDDIEAQLAVLISTMFAAYIGM